MARITKRIVLKFGTGILTQPEANTLDHGQIDRLSADVADAVRAGYECLLVSSGAVGAGLMTLGFAERPHDLAGIQACAAVGQSKLMNLYETAFEARGLHVAQLLLTYRDLDSRKSYANAANTLNRLLNEKNVVPIINENDSVAVEELRFGDNDRLSAEVALLAKADLLILLTSADGLMNGGELIREVENIDAVMQYAKPTKGKLSVGGMASKLLAVKKAVQAGIPTVIASGRAPHVIASILDGQSVGTRFLVKEGC
jgi:glutamate 5-kinase